jgi:hypothetical protein
MSWLLSVVLIAGFTLLGSKLGGFAGLQAPWWVWSLLGLGVLALGVARQFMLGLGEEFQKVIHLLEDIKVETMRVGENTDQPADDEDDLP